jgi:serine/threonine protein kinase
MRSDQKLSTVSVFPREHFGEFDLVFLFLPKLSAHFDLSSLSESNKLQNCAFDFDDYRKVGRIGKGVQGKVHRYKSTMSGELIAVKSSPLKDCDISDGVVNGKILREVHSLMRFHHPCILPLLGYDFQIESKILRIVMPDLGPGSLESVLTSPENYPWISFTSKTMIIAGIVVGMYLIHSGGIIHRDLKPANILLDPTSHCPIIADFGLSREEDVSVTMTHEQGTPLYMAPELLDDEHYCSRYSNKVDIFSFGILLYEIVTGQKPLQDCGCSHVKLFNKIRDGSRASIPDTVALFAADLVSRCWDGDPDRRPKFLEIFYELRDHRFKIFSAVDSQAVEQFLHLLL